MKPGTKYVSFDLANRTIDVVYTKALVNDDEACFGLSSYHDQKVWILEGQGPEFELKTLLHEILHHVLHEAGEITLNANDPRVDRIAGHLAQVLQTLRPTKSPKRIPALVAEGKDVLHGR